MCTISDKLKLCTCKAADVEVLKHYWVLKKPLENGIIMIGTIMPPANIGVEIEKYNIDALTKQLNDGNCFDKDVMLIHGENYILELHFTCFPELYAENYIVYAFIYKNGKWLETEYDHFENNLGKIQGGRIVNPFKKLKN